MMKFDKSGSDPNLLWGPNHPHLQAIGCPITHYPVDYRTGHGTPLTAYALVESLGRWQTALHEWLGLAVYGVTRGSGYRGSLQ